MELQSHDIQYINFTGDLHVWLQLQSTGVLPAYGKYDE